MTPPSSPGPPLSDMARRLCRIIREEALFADGARILVGLSGGADSTALSLLLAELAPEMNLVCAAAHLHHGMRGKAADEDMAFSRNLALGLGWEFYAEEADIPALKTEWRCPAEEAARRVRYDFFHRTARRHGYPHIAVAHHMEDAAETILLRLLRGSGPRGIAGISVKRADGVIRPVLRFRRTELEAYLRERGQNWRTDASNADLSMARNRVRHELLPLLAGGYQPDVVGVLCRLSDLCAREEDWLSGVTETALFHCGWFLSKNGCGEKARNTGGAHGRLNRRRLAEEPPALQRRIIRRALEYIKGDLRRIAMNHVEMIRADLVRPGYRQRHLPGRVLAVMEGDFLFLERSAAPLRERTRENIRFSVPVTGPGDVRMPGQGGVIRFSERKKLPSPLPPDTGQRVAFFDMDRTRFPMEIRSLVPGDRFIPFGMSGSRSVRKFFIDRKIPRNRRRSAAVLVSGDRIAWVIGHRTDERFRVGPRTRRILEVRILICTGTSSD
ncbi:MAG: tRNA lysidine(34) synthetase TilS [Desulfobacterales bacterium]|nr:MAG: tRNA lysidine(34) synthetase TilS [Desulfobacterales bacterium]